MTECYFNNIDWHIKQRLEKAENSVVIVVAWINTTLFEIEFRELIKKVFLFLFFTMMIS